MHLHISSRHVVIIGYPFIIGHLNHLAVNPVFPDDKTFSKIMLADILVMSSIWHCIIHFASFLFFRLNFMYLCSSGPWSYKIPWINDFSLQPLKAAYDATCPVATPPIRRAPVVSHFFTRLCWCFWSKRGISHEVTHQRAGKQTQERLRHLFLPLDSLEGTFSRVFHRLCVSFSLLFCCLITVISIHLGRS